MRLKADDDVRLRHMLQYAEMAAEFTRGRQRRDLDDDGLLELGTRKALEIVGEAAAPVTEATRLSHPEIRWAQIVLYAIGWCTDTMSSTTAFSRAC